MNKLLPPPLFLLCSFTLHGYKVVPHGLLAFTFDPRRASYCAVGAGLRAKLLADEEKCNKVGGCFCYTAHVTKTA